MFNVDGIKTDSAKKALKVYRSLAEESNRVSIKCNNELLPLHELESWVLLERAENLTNRRQGAL